MFIDADMRKGYSQKLFNSAVDSGLSEYLSGMKKIDDIIRTVDDLGVSFIPRGVNPPNPSELLMHERLDVLLQWASEKYDLVIVDTPPILAVTDAAIVGRYAATTLLVSRYEVNTVKEIEVSIRRFEQSGVEVKGCILNGAIKKASSYYGYGYSYFNDDYIDKK